MDVVNDKRVRRKRYVCAAFSIIAKVSWSLLAASVIYGLYVYVFEDLLPPFLTRTLLPAVTGISVAYFGFASVSTKVEELRTSGADRASWTNVGLYGLIILSTVLLFFPLSKSIRYNFAQVLYLSNIDEMPPYDQPTFLSLGDWHADRMRVMPLNTYRYGHFIYANRVYVQSMFLVPIFSKERAYRASAKGWLAFTYEKSVSRSVFEKDRGASVFAEFFGHFKRINVSGFLYFEQFPAGTERRIFTEMARRHSFFQSAYSNIFIGHVVDRDLISLRYFAYFLLSFLFLFIPTVSLFLFLYSPRRR